jgi:glycosyltransferase involved in cell wall biosynthesis
MRLVLFTSYFPFDGEPFLVEEFNVMKKCFEKIIIVSSIKNKKNNTEIVSQNYKVILPREGKGAFSRLIGILFCVLSYSFWHDVFLGCVERKKILPVLKKTFFTCDYIRHLKRCEKQWIFDDEDTIYYSYWLDAAATYLAKNKSTLKGLCISRTHGGDCFYDRGYIPFRKEQLSGLDGIFPISQAGKEDIIKHYGNVVPRLAEKISVARLGIAIPELAEEKMSNGTEKVIVSCSNVIPLKRLDLIIDALLLCDDLDIRWIHFGDGSEMNNIVDRAEQKLDSKENICYEFRGRVPNEEVLSFYSNNRIDLFINCSDVEGIPVSAMEAMAQGIPAIARDVGANSELIDNKCGILLSTEITPYELAEAIKTIISLSEEEHLSISNSAKNKVSESYNAKKNHLEFFEKVVEMSNGNESYNNPRK